MFGLGMVKKRAAKEEMGDVESWLVNQSLRLAAEITMQFKEVPQILAATEGLAFLLHALRRETYRAAEFRAWDGIFEPSMKQMYQVFAMTLSAWSGSEIDRASLSNDAQNLVSSRSLEYQTLPFLAGAPEDRQTVVWNAARRVADATDPIRREEVMAAVLKLFTRVVEFELPEQADRLQKLLYGHRAA